MHSSPLNPITDEFDPSAYLRERRAGLTKAQMEYVSSAYSVPSADSVSELVKTEARAIIRVGGSLVRVHTEVDKPGDSGIGGLRGAVQGFSSASRRRLMRLVASTLRDDRPIFVTLTYPGDATLDGVRFKRDIDVFGKRVVRAFPGSSFVWRIEFKKRKSGESMGLVLPHYHLLVWGVGMVEWREFADKAWYGVVGSGDDKHLKAGVSSERIKTFRGVLRYVSKYIAKVDDEYEFWTGRAWGVCNRKKMPFAPLLTIALSASDAIVATRMLRKMLGLTGKTLVYGVTAIMSSERFWDYLDCTDCFT